MNSIRTTIEPTDEKHGKNEREQIKEILAVLWSIFFAIVLLDQPKKH